MNEDGEDLLAHIRGYVAQRVPPGDVERVTELVALTVVLLMSTPEFYNHLRIVMDLQAENYALRRQIALLGPPVVVRAATKRKAPAKRATPPKRPAPKVTKAKPKPPPPSTRTVSAFRKGASGR